MVTWLVGMLFLAIAAFSIGFFSRFMPIVYAVTRSAMPFIVLGWTAFCIFA